MNDNKSWCPLPWIHLHVRKTGKYAVCMHSTHGKDRGYIPNNNGQVCHVEQNSAEEVMNSDLMKDLRIKMLKGERSDICRRCNTEDDANFHSRRTWEREIWGECNWEHINAVTSPNGTIPLDVQYIDLELGNECTLRCRMCGPQSSSAWYREYHETFGGGFNYDGDRVRLVKNEKGATVAYNDIFNWAHNENALNFILENINSVVQIHLGGGEPLPMPQHRKLIDQLVKSGHSHKIWLDYNTNLSQLKEEWIEKWKTFDRVDFGVSIDGIKEVNEYIRYPSKWPTIESNFKRLLHEEATGSPFKARIAFTYQAFNAWQLPEMYEWVTGLEHFPLNVNPPYINIHPLHRPEYLCVRNFPDTFKQKITEKYNQWFSQFIKSSHVQNMPDRFQKSIPKRIRKVLDSLIAFYSQEPTSDLATLRKWTEMLDQQRGQKLSEVCPETYKALFK
jgi:MoaA/NifB/PqqE/SkfB family radical SAM enzyme